MLSKGMHRKLKPYFVFMDLGVVFTSIILSQIMDTMNLLLVLVLLTLRWTYTEPYEQHASLMRWFQVVFFIFFMLGILPHVFKKPLLVVWRNQINKKVVAGIAVSSFGFILMRLKPTNDMLWLSLLSVAAAILITIIYEYAKVGNIILNEQYRFGGVLGSDYLMVGVFSNLFTGCFIGGMMWSLKKHRKFMLALFSVAVVVSLTSSFLTGTRGAWLGLPEIVIGWSIFYYVEFCTKKNYLHSMVVALLIFGIVFLGYFLVGEKISARIDVAKQDIMLYQQGQPISSIGLRFVMYEAAIESIKDNPLYGVGSENIGPELKERTRQIFHNKFDMNRSGFDSWDTHNQYLQEAFSGGILGFFSLLFVQIYLLIFFIKHRVVNQLWAVSGMIFVVASAINMMSYSWLRFNDGMFFYFIVATLLVYGASQPEIEERSK